MGPNQKLKILILEDQIEDVYLINRELKKANLEFALTIVDSKIEYINSLNSQKPDIILSDHSLPQFNSLEALQICKEKRWNIPFILVTGTVSEEFAAQCIKNGADDYVLKSNIKRLSTSISHALRHHEEERKRLEAEQMIIDQNTELIKINSELDSFSYNISHNLRAPLLSLIGLVNLAKTDTRVLNSTMLEDYLDKIDWCAKKLDKTLCDILDYSKNARGELIYEVLDVSSIFRDEYEKIYTLKKPALLIFKSK
ncbi:MAG: response regulator [Cyclobacteriaceae bacterium]|nr:response regulator [Cyclobacteriaceae bacterium]